jgi:hypothetical protein
VFWRTVWQRVLWHVRVTGILLIAGVTTCWSQTASPQVDGIDTLLRAAYCVGALNELMRLDSESAARGDGCANGKEPFASVEECVAFLKEATEAYRSTFEEKKARYVLARKSEATNRSIYIAALSGKKVVGTLSAKAKQSRALECAEKCRSTATATCTVDCVRQYDPMEANVLRCEFGPDDLPF